MYQVIPPDASFPKVRKLAGQALALDDTLAEAYTARAAAADFSEFDWLSAERDFQRALAVDPNFSLAHHWYAEHLLGINKADRAVMELERARELDPLSPAVNGTLGRAYRDARRLDDALRQCRKLVEFDPHHEMGHWCLSQVYAAQHRYAAAISELELANALGSTPLILRDLGWMHAAVGNTGKAKEILEALQARGAGYVSPYGIAAIYGALGNKDEGFRWLKRAYEEHDCQMTYLALDTSVDPLRSDPRFGPLLAKLRIP